MRLYEGTVSAFNAAVIQNRVADDIAVKYESYYKKRVSPSEYRSWQQSLNFLRNSFEYTALIDNRVIIEYGLPYSTRRIDVLVFGPHQEHRGGNPAYWVETVVKREC